MNTSQLDRITVEPGKCGGRPCIRGQRIRVTDVLGLLGAGASHEEILEDYPFAAGGLGPARQLPEGGIIGTRTAQFPSRVR